MANISKSILKKAFFSVMPTEGWEKYTSGLSLIHDMYCEYSQEKVFVSNTPALDSVKSNLLHNYKRLAHFKLVFH